MLEKTTRNETEIELNTPAFKKHREQMQIILLQTEKLWISHIF